MKNLKISLVASLAIFMTANGFAQTNVAFRAVNTSNDKQKVLIYVDAGSTYSKQFTLLPDQSNQMMIPSGPNLYTAQFTDSKTGNIVTCSATSNVAPTYVIAVYHTGGTCRLSALRSRG